MDFKVALTLFLSGILTQLVLFLFPKFSVREVPKLILVLILGSVVYIPVLISQADFLIGEGLITVTFGFVLFFSYFFKDKLTFNVGVKDIYLIFLFTWLTLYQQILNSPYLLTASILFTLISAIFVYLHVKRPSGRYIDLQLIYLIVLIAVGLTLFPDSFYTQFGGKSFADIKTLELIISGMIFMRIGSLIVLLPHHLTRQDKKLSSTENHKYASDNSLTWYVVVATIFLTTFMLSKIIPSLNTQIVLGVVFTFFSILR